MVQANSEIAITGVVAFMMPTDENQTKVTAAEPSPPVKSGHLRSIDLLSVLGDRLAGKHVLYLGQYGIAASLCAIDAGAAHVHVLALDPGAVKEQAKLLEHQSSIDIGPLAYGRMDLPAGTFDIVLVDDALRDSEAPIETIIRECARVMKPDANLALRHTDLLDHRDTAAQYVAAALQPPGSGEQQAFWTLLPATGPGNGARRGLFAKQLELAFACAGIGLGHAAPESTLFVGRKVPHEARALAGLLASRSGGKVSAAGTNRTIERLEAKAELLKGLVGGEPSAVAEVVNTVINEVAAAIRSTLVDGDFGLAAKLVHLGFSFAPGHPALTQQLEQVLLAAVRKAKEADNDAPEASAAALAAWQRVVALDPSHQTARRRVLKHAKALVLTETDETRRCELYGVLAASDPEHPSYIRRYTRAAITVNREDDAIAHLLAAGLHDALEEDAAPLVDRAARGIESSLATGMPLYAVPQLRRLAGAFAYSDRAALVRDKVVRALSKTLLRALIDEAEQAARAAAEALDEFAADMPDALQAMARYASRYLAPEDAVRYLERLVAVEPENQKALLDLARALRKTGRLDEAEVCSRALLKLAPANSQALTMLDQIRSSRQRATGAA